MSCPNCAELKKALRFEVELELNALKTFNFFEGEQIEPQVKAEIEKERARLEAVLKLTA